METNLTIGQAIRKARGKVLLKDLAAETGLSLTYLSDVQNDKTQPSIKSLLKIASALKVEPGRLLNYCAETDESELETYRLWMQAFLEFMKTAPVPTRRT